MCIYLLKVVLHCFEHYKMSNENCKHHENWEKVEGGLTRTFQGTLFLILLCKVTGAGDFENHIYFRDSQENFLSINPTTQCFFSNEKPKIICS